MTQQFLGTGWAFPIRPSAQGALNFLGGEEKIRQSIWLILSTAPGERVMRPDFGCGIHELVFQPNTAGIRGLIAESVRDALITWEPRIDVLDVSVESPPEASDTFSLESRNQILIRVDYQVRSNNTVNNLVYPFFLTEGASSFAEAVI